MEILNSNQLDEFEFISIVGRGTFGRVFKVCIFNVKSMFLGKSQTFGWNCCSKAYNWRQTNDELRSTDT